MARCDVCGNEYDKAFFVQTADGARRSYDSVECAAHEIAPRCEHCGCMVLGHGVEVDGMVYCCRHCAESKAGETPLADRV